MKFIRNLTLTVGAGSLTFCLIAGFSATSLSWGCICGLTGLTICYIARGAYRHFTRQQRRADAPPQIQGR